MHGQQLRDLHGILLCSMVCSGVMFMCHAGAFLTSASWCQLRLAQADIIVPPSPPPTAGVNVMSFHLLPATVLFVMHLIAVQHA